MRGRLSNHCRLVAHLYSLRFPPFRSLVLDGSGGFGSPALLVIQGWQCYSFHDRIASCHYQLPVILNGLDVCVASIRDIKKAFVTVRRKVGAIECLANLWLKIERVALPPGLTFDNYRGNIPFVHSAHKTTPKGEGSW